MDNIQEMLAIPFKVKPVATFDGLFTLYSSNRLKLKYTKMLSKEKNTKSVSTKLSKLVLEGNIVPCFVSKGMLRYFSSKLLGFPMKGVAGFYNPKIQKIYVLVDTQSNIFGFSSNYVLSYTTLHECMHMCSSLNPQKFLSLFKESVIDYYTFVFRNCLGIEPGIDFDPEPIVMFLWKNFEQGWKSVSKNTIVKYGKLLEDYKKLSYLSPDKFDNNIEKIQFVAIASLWKPRSIESMYYKSEFQSIFKPLYNGYRNIFKIKNPQEFTLAYQEFLLPSEVVSIQTAKPNSKNYAAVNSI